MERVFLEYTCSHPGCFCGNSIGVANSQIPTSFCTMACAGDSKQECGNGNYIMSVFNSTVSNQTQSQSQVAAASSNSTATQQSVGCYQDVGTLNGAYYYSNWMAADNCVYWCRNQGYQFAGINGGSEFSSRTQRPC